MPPPAREVELPARPRLRFAVPILAALAAAPAAAQPNSADREICRAHASAAFAYDLGDDERTMTAAFREAIAICERALDPDDPLLASLIEDLARVSLEAGRNDEAGQLLRRALTMRERAQGSDHAGVAWTAAALAEVLWQRAHHTAEAEALLRRALAIAARQAEIAAPADRLAAREIATRRALQLTRFLLDQWRTADAAATLDAARDDGAPLDAGHFQTGRGEIALERGEICAAADAYRRAAEEYRYAFFADESHADRRWFQAWLEQAPMLLVRLGRREEAGILLFRLVASRNAVPRVDALTARAQNVLEALPPAGSGPERAC